MKRWLHNWWTAHRLRMLIQYGWCPKCNSSPPGVLCLVCFGSNEYGPRMNKTRCGQWAGRYVQERGR